VSAAVAAQTLMASTTITVSQFLSVESLALQSGGKGLAMRLGGDDDQRLVAGQAVGQKVGDHPVKEVFLLVKLHGVPVPDSTTGPNRSIHRLNGHV